MITINIDKAKAIAHDKRRAAREAEFKPYDDAIAKQIPEQVDGAEAQRQAIREKYAAIQQSINAATTVEQLRARIETFEAK